MPEANPYLTRNGNITVKLLMDSKQNWKAKFLIFSEIWKTAGGCCWWSWYFVYESPVPAGALMYGSRHIYVSVDWYNWSIIFTALRRLKIIYLFTIGWPCLVKPTKSQFNMPCFPAVCCCTMAEGKVQMYVIDKIVLCFHKLFTVS